MNTTETMAPRCQACKDHLACYGSWAGDKMPEILWVSVQISTWYFRAMRMLILCVGMGMFSAVAQAFLSQMSWRKRAMHQNCEQMQPRCSSAT